MLLFCLFVSDQNWLVLAVLPPLPPLLSFYVMNFLSFRTVVSLLLIFIHFHSPSTSVERDRWQLRGMRQRQCSFVIRNRFFDALILLYTSAHAALAQLRPPRQHPLRHLLVHLRYHSLTPHSQQRYFFRAGFRNVVMTGQATVWE